jgi:ubiquinone/menaquinone biosynthesis C-methylase UbiE
MLLLRLLLIAGAVVIFLVPALILALLFLMQFAARIVTKVFGYKSPAPPFFGPLLDSDLRRAFQDPRGIMERSGIRENMRVLEVGCGSGAFTALVARRILPDGTEYALDVQPEMLTQLESKLARKENSDIHNVMLVHSDAARMPFHNDFFDLVFMVSVLQQIGAPQAALAEIRRVLKPGGILAVTEIFLDPYYAFRSTTAAAGRAAGFTVEAVLGSAWHYTIRFRK